MSEIPKPLTAKELDSIQKLIMEKCRFAPSNGICWKCKKNIYSKIIIKEDMETITGCPYADCKVSYVD